MTQLPPLIKGCCPEGKRRVLVTVSYDGTAYAGWQRQQNALAVQQVLDKAGMTTADIDLLIPHQANLRLQPDGRGRSRAGAAGAFRYCQPHSAGQVSLCPEHLPAC